ncbi:uncharacterized protein LOC6553518 isoform X2 [Drosophila erecta]|uniref:uncharacterized protein LOC6553518 isoform X2 n=1 Tax=Drosophila erecta TaxID=7220 RepID=UPI000F058F86|nr:uncharacterized protein LOC6553518 isoform X2 [Drosophila erecta]
MWLIVLVCCLWMAPSLGQLPPEIEKCKAGDSICIAETVTRILRLYPNGLSSIGLDALDSIGFENVVVSRMEPDGGKGIRSGSAAGPGVNWLDSTAKTRWVLRDAWQFADDAHSREGPSPGGDQGMPRSLQGAGFGGSPRRWQGICWDSQGQVLAGCAGHAYELRQSFQ